MRTRRGRTLEARAIAAPSFSAGVSRGLGTDVSVIILVRSVGVYYVHYASSASKFEFRNSSQRSSLRLGLRARRALNLSNGRIGRMEAEGSGLLEHRPAPPACVPMAGDAGAPSFPNFRLL